MWTEMDVTGERDRGEEKEMEAEAPNELELYDIGVLKSVALVTRFRFNR